MQRQKRDEVLRGLVVGQCGSESLAGERELDLRVLTPRRKTTGERSVCPRFSNLILPVFCHLICLESSGSFSGSPPSVARR